MKSTNFYAILVICILFPGSLAGQQTDLSETIGQLDEIFSVWNSTETPGCAVGVEYEGRPVVSRAYGMADLEHLVPNTPSTIFEAGSVSKQFVAASVIMLALEEKMSLDDDIRDYVPELPDYHSAITLRHLLNHTSGLRDWGSVAEISGWGRAVRSHNHDHVLDILSRQSSLNFPPGERYSYSNSGYNLMAIIIERVAGIPFAEFSAKKIFEPLGMTQTEWRADYTRIVKNRSSAYTGNEGDDNYSINRPIEYVHGNGGLLTTVGDLLTWNRALSQGYFGEKFMDELLKQGVLASGRTISYASGVRIDSDHGYPQVAHTGATSGYRAYLSWYPGQKLSVALLCNVTGANPGSLGSDVSALFLDEIEEIQPDSREGVSLNKETLKEKTGFYADARNYRPLEIVYADDTLRVKGGPMLIPSSGGLFQAGNSDIQFSFMDDDESDRFSIQIINEGYLEEVYHPVNGVNLSYNPDEYTGTFIAPEAETEIQIKEVNNALIIYRRPADSFETEAVYEDAFHADGFGLIRFLRDERGEVTGFAYSSGRVYDMRFHKQEGYDTQR